MIVEKTDQRIDFARKILKRFEKPIKSSKSVLVKPNLVSYESYPTTTHPNLLKEVLKFLLKKEKKILVADGPAADPGNHSLKKVCQRLEVSFLNLHEGKFIRKTSKDNFELEVSDVPFKYDLMISLPVLKEHMVCGLTGALKNQFGFLSDKERGKLHHGSKNIHQGIAELNTIIRPDLVLMDGIETLIKAQELRHGGEKAKLGYMLAGTDPVKLDMKGYELLSKITKLPKEVKHIEYAKRLRI